MSGQTVVGDALQFTADNKHAYGYSGLIEVSTARTKLLEFETNSSYIVAEFQPTYFTLGTGEDAYFEVSIDGVLIYNVEITSSTNSTPYQEVEFIIPPNVTFKIEAFMNSGTRNLGAIITGKVGMPPRVGNLVNE